VETGSRSSGYVIRLGVKYGDVRGCIELAFETGVISYKESAAEACAVGLDG
jgi:hypothetical protein